MTAATHSEFSIKSDFCLKDIPKSPGLCFDEEKVSYNIFSLAEHSDRGLRFRVSFSVKRSFSKLFL